MEEFLNINDVNRYITDKKVKNKKNATVIKLDDITINYDKQYQHYKIIANTIEKSKKVTSEITIKHVERYNVNEIRDSICQCLGGDRCSHVYNTLLLLQPLTRTSIQSIVDGENTLQGSTSVLETIEKDIINDVKSSRQKYILVPKISIDENNQFNLQIKIGYDFEQLYLISNLSSFIERLEKQESHAYSNRFICDHKIEHFDEYSKNLNKFIFSKIQVGETQKNIALNDYDLYFLLNILKNKAILLEDDKLIVKKKMPLYLDIVKKKAKFEISIDFKHYKTYNFKAFALIIGEKHVYYKKYNDAYDHQIFSSLTENPIEINALNFHNIYSNVLENHFNFIKLSKTCVIDEKVLNSVKINLYIDLDSSKAVDLKIEVIDFNDKVITSEHILQNNINYLKLTKFLDKYKRYSKFKIVDTQDIVDFYQHELAKLEPLCTSVFLNDKVKKARVIDNPDINLDLSLSDSLLSISLNFEDQELDFLKDLLTQYESNKKYYRLANGDFINIQNNQFKKISKMLKELNITKANIKKNEVLFDQTSAIAAVQKLHESEIQNYKIDTKINSLIETFDSKKYLDVLPGENLCADLREYQLLGFRFLKTIYENKFGCLLADDMGLGKTVQVISLLADTNRTNLVVCPSSLVLNWESEFQKFAPNLSVYALKENKENRELIIKDYEKYDVIITSYDTLKRDLELYEDIQFNSMIIDEAQYIKNPNTKGAKSVKAINSQVKIALTGTPIENSLRELWSIFDFILPGYLSNYSDFQKRFELPISRDFDEDRKKQLISLVSPYTLRRLKKEVLTELPEKSTSILYSEFSSEQKNLYNAHILKMQEDLSSTESTNKIEYLSMLMRLRQICCHPKLLKDNSKCHSAKMQQALELIESSVQSGHSVLLFSQFTSMLALLQEELDKKGIDYNMLTGKHSKDQRQESIDSFNNGGPRVFLISLKAGGTGLNLTKADVVIHYDPWWNRASENQATDRAYRIGQKNNIQVYKLISKDTIEEKILEIQDMKDNLSQMVISDVSNPITNMTKEDFSDLLAILK